MAGLTIGEVAHQAGVEPSTLRYYERIGILPKPERVSGRRRYSARVFRWLAVIQVAKAAGFTLSEIKLLLNDFSDDVPPSSRWRELARQKLPEVESLISRALGMKLLLEQGIECDCLSFDECLLLNEKHPA